MKGAHCGAASSAAPPMVVARTFLRVQGSMSESCGLADARGLRVLRLHLVTLPGLASRASPRGIREVVQMCILANCDLQKQSRSGVSVRSVVPKP